MNVIFLTVVHIDDVNKGFVYTDLMRRFRDDGHQVYIVSTSERRLGQKTTMFDNNGVKILNVRTLNVVKTNILEKGIGTVLIERQFISAIKKYLSDIKFDLITYSTPPITFCSVIKYLKKQNPHAISYLLLKDIFPQNAVDMDFFSKRSIFYWYFRMKEISLYKISDYIGCMSPANVHYVVSHNPFCSKNRVEVAPNSIELPEKNRLDKTEKDLIRGRYDLPTNLPIIVYGGNLGKPQGIDYLIKCLDANKHRQDCFFLIIGSGTDFAKLQKWYNKNTNINVLLMESLPRAEFEDVVRSCDVGMIFLDYHFTIPNYPSRLLSYLGNGLPVLCATDLNTDIGKIAEENGYGFWCESKNVEDFSCVLDKILKSNMAEMGQKGYLYFKENYLVDNTYNVITKHLSDV